MNKALTPLDFDGIGTECCPESGLAKPDHLQKAKIENHGLGLSSAPWVAWTAGS